MAATRVRDAVLAIDQGTTNTKAVLVAPDGSVLQTASAPVEVTHPQTGWAEQDAEQIWSSVLTAIQDCQATDAPAEVVAVALSTQRESVVGWHRRNGRPAGPLIGWQDVRTTGWCEALPREVHDIVERGTGLRVDPMFSAPKVSWLLTSGALDPPSDACIGTVDSWLVWRLTGGRAHLTDAGNASRTLLYDIDELDWSGALLDAFGIPRHMLPEVLPSNGHFGTVSDAPGLRDGIPVSAVLADSHAALYGQGCTRVGMAKATYGTGSSVMTPVPEFDGSSPAVPYTLAWLTDVPRYAREGNIVSSGSALAWTAEALGLRGVAELFELAVTVPDADGVVLVPALAGLGAPHWDRHVRATFGGMTTRTTRAHLARAAVDAVAHQICDVVDSVEATGGTKLSAFRADGGATAADLLMQTQADLLGRRIEVADVAEVSALGAAQLAWESLGVTTRWADERTPARVYDPGIDDETRSRLRKHWGNELAAARAPR